MSEQTNVNADTSTTDNTNIDDTTTEESPAIENAPVNDKPVQDEPEKEGEKAADGQETAETKPEGAPEKYELDELPKDVTISDDAKNSLFDLGKKHDLTNEALNDFVKEHIKANETAANAIAEAQLAEDAKMMSKWDETNKINWGTDFDKNMATINKVITRFIPKTEVKEGELPLSHYLIGNPDENGKMPPINPLLGNFLLEIGKVMSSDTLETGQAQSGKNKSLYDKFKDLNTS